MGAFSIWHWLIVLVVVLVLFGGGGKISRLMGDFKKGIKEEEASDDKTEEPKTINSEAANTAESSDKDKASSS